VPKCCAPKSRLPFRGLKSRFQSLSEHVAVRSVDVEQGAPAKIYQKDRFFVGRPHWIEASSQCTRRDDINITIAPTNSRSAGCKSLIGGITYLRAVSV
jgi:hypothetical protein